MRLFIALLSLSFVFAASEAEDCDSGHSECGMPVVRGHLKKRTFTYVSAPGDRQGVKSEKSLTGKE